MGQAILDGFERGFNMMERHNERVGRNERTARLDEQNQSRYQDSQQRLSDIDEKNDARYKDTLAYREKQMQSQADYRNQSTEATKEYRNWQKSKQEKDTLWAKDQQMLGVGWQYFRENGQVAPEHEEMFQRNKGYDPRTLQQPEMRANIKALSGKMQEVIKSGKMSEVNNPENVKLFNSVFKDKFASSIGTTDPVTGKVIKDVDFTGFVPVEDDKEHRVSFALKVTYEDGTVKVKPKTKGGTTEEDDPVLTMKPDELMATVKAKVMMADMIDRPDYWDKMGASLGVTQQKQSAKPNWKEVKGGMGQTLGYQNLNDGSFQKLNDGAEVAGMNPEQKVAYDENAAAKHTQQFIGGASEINKSMSLGLNDSDIKTAVEIFETQARTSGADADLNKLMTDILQAHAKNKVKRSEQHQYAKEHSADNVMNRTSKGLF